MADPHVALSDAIGRLYGAASKEEEEMKPVTPKAKNRRRKSSQQPAKKMSTETTSQIKTVLKSTSKSTSISKSAEPVLSTEPVLSAMSSYVSGDEKNFDKTQWEGSRWDGGDGEPDLDRTQLSETATIGTNSNEVLKKLDAGMTTNYIGRRYIPIPSEDWPPMRPWMSPSAMKSVTKSATKSIIKSTSKSTSKFADEDQPSNFGNQICLFVVNILLFSCELGLHWLSTISEISDINSWDLAAVMAYAAINNLFISALCLCSISLEIVLLILNKDRQKCSEPLLKGWPGRIVLQLAKSVLVFVHIILILLWRYNHGILSLAVGKTSPEGLGEYQQFERNTVKAVVTVLLQLLLLLFVETYLLYFGPSLAAKTGSKKKSLQQK